MYAKALGVIGLAIGCAAAACGQDAKPKADPRPQYERMLKGEDAKKAKELERQISGHEAADRYPEAIKAAKELLSLRTRIQEADHWEVVSQHWSTRTLETIGSLGDAQRDTWRRRASRAREANALAMAAKYEGVMPILRDALKECQDTLGECHPETAQAYYRLANVLNAQRQYGDALAFNRKALAIRRSLLGQNHPETAASHHNVAYTLNFMGKYADAAATLRDAIDIRLRVLGESHYATANSYSLLAYTFGVQGDHAGAQALYHKALDIYLVVRGKQHPDTLKTISSLAAILNSLGRYADAQQLLQQVLDTRRNLLSDDHPDVARSYNNLAVNLDDQGKYADALPLHRRALEIRLKVHGDSDPLTANSHSNLASCLQSVGLHDDAHIHYERALTIRVKTLTEKHIDTAAGYHNLGFNLSARDRQDDARKHIQKALDIRVKLLGDEHPDTGTSYMLLAATFFAQGRYSEAREPTRKALATHQKVLSDIHPSVVRGWKNLAYAMHAQGEYDESTAALESAARSYEAARLRVSVTGVDRAAFGEEFSPYHFLAAARTRSGLSTDAWSAIEADSSRGLLDEELSRRGYSLSPAEEQLRTRLTRTFDELQPSIVQLATSPRLAPTDRQELASFLRQRREAEQALSQLAVTVSGREVASLANVQSVIPNSAALLVWVDVADRFGGVQEHWGCVARSTGPPVWERLPGTGVDKKWVKADTDLPNQFRAAFTATDRHVPAAEVADLARRFHAQRIAPLEKHLAGVAHLYVVPVNAMAGVPVEALTDKYTVSYTPSGTYLARLKDRKRPSGPASLLAVGDAVFDPAGRKAAVCTELPPGGLLIQQVVPGGNAANARLQPGDVLVSYAGTDLTSAGQLGQLVTEHAAAKSVVVKVWREADAAAVTLTRDLPPGTLGVVLAPEPARDAVTARRKTDEMLAKLRAGKDWADLPGTRVEIVRVAKLFGNRATTLTDSAASEQRLEELRASGKLKDYRYLHLATHGESNDVKAFGSALILSRDKLPTDLPRAGEKYIDGRLTAQEVLDDWKLDAELVTLSACESGLGRKGGGDGLLGFAQAFLLAGSRSVCLSLWKVDDTATALLMDRFYQNLLGKRDGLAKPLGKAASLAEAKNWLRALSADEAARVAASLTGGVARAKGQKAVPLLPAVPTDPMGVKEFKPFAHPKYWAAFVLIGDPE